MKVRLGEFACASLETHFGPDLSAGAQAAVRHYARRLRSQTQPAAVPFLPGLVTPAGRAGAELELPVEPEVEAALGREARRQAVPVERIVSHAVFVYLADLDAAAAGRSGLTAEEGRILPRYGDDARLRAQDVPASRGRGEALGRDLAPRRRARGARAHSRNGLGKR